LLAATRRRKGVTFAQAERETKIRGRYLAALERGDYWDLPGSVYTKGFLRNYAVYLGLDPDEVLSQWRVEHGRPRDPAPLIAIPRPLEAPRKGFTFSRGIVVVVLLAIVVVGFGAYLGVQVLRFAKPPTISVSDPATAVLDVAESTTAYRLRGVSVPGALVSIDAPGRDPYQVTAGSDGAWTADVDLRRGRNQFDVSSVDADTGKHSESTVRLFITVPLAAATAAPDRGRVGGQ